MSRNRCGLLRLLKRHSISSMYWSKCLPLIWWKAPTMDHLNSDQNDSMPLKCKSLRPYSPFEWLTLLWFGTGA